MTKRRLILLSSGLLIALLVAGLIGVAVVSAQESTPESPVPFGERAGGRGPDDLGGGIFAMARGGGWMMFDAVAEAMGLTPVELFTELHEGKRVVEIAEEQGVEMDDLREAVDAARGEARKQAVEQAVEDGKLSRERADWLLEGLEKGFMPRAQGFGRGRGRDRPPEGA